MNEATSVPQTSTEEARKLVAIACRRVPNLTSCGIGAPDEKKVRRAQGQAAVDALIAEGQRTLRAELEAVALCADWVKLQRPRQTINRSFSSYGLKHVVESWCGTYISNGAFIAAAVGLGYRFERCCAGSGPNTAFNFSTMTVKAAMRPDPRESR